MFWQTASLKVLKCSHSTLKNKYMYAEFKERAEYVSYGKIIDKISTWRSREKSRATYSFYKWNKLGNLCTNELN